MTEPEHVLAVIGYGAPRPDDCPPHCHYLAAPLAPASPAPAYEIWSCAEPVRVCEAGRVRGACSPALAFGALTIEEQGDAPLEAVIEQAYRDIFTFLAEAGGLKPIRLWNYLASITADQQGLERYRRFNIGRHRAYLDELRQPVPPAASCLGAPPGGSVIYFLAAPEAAHAIENPRQISAYNYPAIYGPRSPSFSRAGAYGSALFISGTASIVGHETRHRGDLRAQLAETIENLRAIMGAAGLTGSPTRAEDWALKIYLRNPADQPLVEPTLAAAFGAHSQRLYLVAEICRADLLLEIEAFYAGSGAATF